MPDQDNENTAIAQLNHLLADYSSPTLAEETGQKFADYLGLLQRWNTRINLTAIRDAEGIHTHHFLESILCARNLPIGIVSLLDFGSGAGFPGIPIALVRPEISVTLAESQHKKAAFLREVVRTLNISVHVHSARAETLPGHFDCVTLRAVDQLHRAIPAAIPLLAPNGWLAILTTKGDAMHLQSIAEESARFRWEQFHPMLHGTQRVLLLGMLAS